MRGFPIGQRSFDHRGIFFCHASETNGWGEAMLIWVIGESDQTMLYRRDPDSSAPPQSKI